MVEAVTIELDGSQKALNPCLKCGSCRAIVKPGTGPHAKRLECDGCGRFHNWLGLDAAISLGLYERVD